MVKQLIQEIKIVPYSLLIILLISCKGETVTLSYDGIWEQIGYGKIFDIKGDSVTVYDICSSGCNIFERTLLIEEGIPSSTHQDSLLITKNIKTYTFKKLPELPRTCLSKQKDLFDPKYNFEILWNTFNEHYCYFEDRQIDWIEKYKFYESMISDSTSQLELFRLSREMLASIDDGHVTIQTPDSLKDTLEKLENAESTSGKTTQKLSRFDLADLIIKRYCQDYKTHNSGITQWGITNKDIAYLQINAMLFMAFYEIANDLELNEFGQKYSEIASNRTFQRQDEIDGAKKIMDSIFIEIQNTQALIIDLRFNTGGKDEVGLELAGHLVENNMKIASKKAKIGNSFANHQNIYLESRIPFYDKDVFILTSGVSSSATEVAILATLDLNNVTRIGSHTEGIFSDALDKILPNGWEYTLSNEIYEDLEGRNYEGIGIKPHIELNYPPLKPDFINHLYDQILAGEDEAIERVVKLRVQ